MRKCYGEPNPFKIVKTFIGSKKFHFQKYFSCSSTGGTGTKNHLTGNGQNITAGRHFLRHKTATPRANVSDRYSIVSGCCPIVSGCHSIVSGRSPIVSGCHSIASGRSPIASRCSPIVSGRHTIASGCSPIVSGCRTIISAPHTVVIDWSDAPVPPEKARTKSIFPKRKKTSPSNTQSPPSNSNPLPEGLPGVQGELYPLPRGGPPGAPRVGAPGGPPEATKPLTASLLSHIIPP